MLEKKNNPFPLALIPDQPSSEVISEDAVPEDSGIDPNDPDIIDIHEYKELGADEKEIYVRKDMKINPMDVEVTEVSEESPSKKPTGAALKKYRESMDDRMVKGGMVNKNA